MVWGLLWVDLDGLAGWVNWDGGRTRSRRDGRIGGRYGLTCVKGLDDTDSLRVVARGWVVLERRRLACVLRGI